ncbi:hypothetical protein [Niallia sp. NCCP-28]|uniref:hypothetical protein n=1 Tax=Niallia sp. NCCP-28 TaxID=2934712 RepID=UPI002089697D|nr:hypothetical protein [Niallia sp. NCCP-28]GKU82567.1 hypothetical protein NCCP28_19630 [Niallia sp. NCCP-28]
MSFVYVHTGFCNLNELDAAQTDGLIRYGSEVNGFASGIRFSKQESDPTVYFTNGDGSIGEGKLDAKQVRARETLIVNDVNVLDMLNNLKERMETLENN